MLTSGNGQHRRPRQAPRFVVAVGATGAGIALPLLAAGSGHAATSSTWDKVAGCESGGRWSADDGGGFYGGLALTLDTWRTFGGTAYAERPDLASRQQQIAVAQLVLDAEGPGHWATCAVQVGLVPGGPTPGVDPGTAPPAAPTTDPGLLGGLGLVSPPATHPAPTAPVTTAPATTAPPSGTGAPTDGGNVPSAPASGSHGSSSPSGAPSATADPPASGGPGAAVPSAPSGRHARPVPAAGGDREAGEPSGPGTRVAGQPARHRAPGADTYTVRPGDNLDRIAAQHSVDGGWSALYDLNRPLLGDDPDLILPGVRLALG